MALADRLELAALDQARLHELANRLEQAQPDLAAWARLAGGEQGLAPELLDDRNGLAWSREHRLRGVERKAAPEHSARRQAAALRLAEHLPGPGDGALQGRVALRRVQRPLVQERKLSLEPSLQPLQPQHVHPRGGELQRQRDALQPSHDRLNASLILRSLTEVRAQRASALQKERLRLCALRKVQRWDLNHALTSQVEPLSGGRQDLEVLALIQPGAHRGRAQRDQLLEVVEHEQTRPQTRDRIAPGLEPELMAERRAQPFCVVDGGQIHKPHRHVLRDGVRKLQRERGLSKTRRPPQSDQAPGGLQGRLEALDQRQAAHQGGSTCR